MRFSVVPACLLAFAATQAHAQTAEVKFSDLQSVIPGEDAGICQTRYGDSYVTSPHENGADHHKKSDQGHTIHIKKQNMSMHHGVWVFNNEYEVGFSDGTSTEAYVYATAVSKFGGFAGVFSDGRCKGKVTFAHKK